MLDYTEQAIARQSITAVMHRYARLARENCPWDELAKLVAPGGIYRLANGQELGAHEMENVVRGREAKFIRHHITTIDVVFVSDDEARTEAQFFAATEHTPMDHWGSWRDIFRKQPDGGWLIADRTICVDGYAPGGWCDKVYGAESLKTSQNRQ